MKPRASSFTLRCTSSPSYMRDYMGLDYNLHLCTNWFRELFATRLEPPIEIEIMLDRTGLLGSTMQTFMVNPIQSGGN